MRDKYPWNKRKKDDDSMMNEVYAGPEPPDLRPMEGVYAGPPMMCVYAGPEFFNGTSSAAAQGEPVPTAETQLFCAVCGVPVEPSYKFCPACGTVIEREEA